MKNEDEDFTAKCEACNAKIPNDCWLCDNCWTAKKVQFLHENPQQLVDEETEFQFEETGDRVKLVDAIAAGTAFYGFRFMSGPYAGKTIYCECEENRCTYSTNQNSDGFLFNWLNDNESQGDFIPELNGKILTLK